jgi:hypothetical protein
MIGGTFQPCLDGRMFACFKKLTWMQPLKELLAGSP